ncbi:DEAD/DEAH box RNA helicase [Thraustotheca clavata]|uniref:RNA helicase n=1 Tax=Thraustotheca clavata TaxID=74557 RepID=A0A1W0AAG8_9STRA|nr:DEAD/DEAH box RNA helicase [Thraustotheca clavata]
MSDGDIDPLDAFMAGIEAQVAQETSVRRPKIERCTFEEEHTEAKVSAHASTDQIYEEDMEEWHRQNKNQELQEIAGLDHSKIQYESFRKAFYKPNAPMSPAEIQQLRRELDIRVELPFGVADVGPIRSFMHAGFSKKTLGLLMKYNLEAPTPIQSQTFPLAMSGHDLIAIAQTGSGKTLAFVLPMIVHIMDQRYLEKDEGPIAIILSPTRELAHQIFVEAKKFSMDANCAAIYGGAGNKWDQIQSLKKGAEIVVATPGRLMEHLRKRVIKSLHRVTFVVLDEADRMFEMGFEAQLRSILGQIRPDRQTLLFSATFRRRVEALARDVLKQPVKIIVGTVGQANDDIKQIGVVLTSQQAKWNWLIQQLPSLVSQGKLLVFVTSKAGVDELSTNLNSHTIPFNCVSIHGDKSQYERSDALHKFKTSACPILIATDVAARGLDIKGVSNVVNYDIAKNIDTHVHRIGRTGRMGVDGIAPGTAYTLLTSTDIDFAAQLVNNMDLSNQPVSNELLNLAARSPHFHRRNAPKGEKKAGGTSQSSNTRDDEDDEIEREFAMEQIRPKSKQEQRRGLGFGCAKSSGNRNAMGFVPASSPSSMCIEQTFGFVKSTTKQPRQLYSAPPPVIRPPPPEPAKEPKRSRWGEQPPTEAPRVKKSRWDN